MKKQPQSPLHLPPRMPRDLGKRARRIWKEIVPVLIEAKIGLCRLDEMVLEAYCSIAATLEEMEEQIDRDGRTLVNEVTCKRYPHPLIPAVKDYQELKFSYAEDIGLPPRSRKKIRDALKNQRRRS